jgi:single-stranded DNA-binding protein
MAIKVEFEAWLNEVKTFDWGYVANLAHDQRAKNDQTGEWETVGKDYVDVTITAEQMHGIEGATKVYVQGTLKADAYVGKDGSAKPKLKVRAQEIRPVDRQDPVAIVKDILGVPAVTDDLPF